MMKKTSGLPYASLPKKIDLGDQLQGFYGQHRSGWPYVLQLLSRLQTANGIWLDSFIERTFCWHPDGPRANLRPWIGFIHVPPQVPEWFQSEQSNSVIFQTDLWQRSLPFCRGLYTLSRYHRRHLESRLHLPINDLLFPTEEPELKWSWAQFDANRNKKIVQVGWWLRRLHTIFMLPTRSYKKIFLRITHADIDGLLKKEREQLLRAGVFHDGMYDTAQEVSSLPDRDYDRLLAENIAIVDLYDSSANNTIIECIVRNTPILVNPIEPVREYLGDDYPLYFSSLAEAAEKAENMDAVHEAHCFLRDHPLKKKLTGEHFLRSLVDSPIYRGLEP
jgi:hypothetical protein